MSGRDEMRKMMDEMMGVERDIPVDQRVNRKRHFTDDDVCKYYICGLNPYSLFTNTKSYLGPYDQIEDDECQREFQALSQQEKNEHPYEYDLMQFLDKLVHDMDREIARKQDRVRQENEEPEMDPELRAKIAEFRLSIEALQAKAEEEGEEGNVDEALKLQKEAEALIEEKQKLENETRGLDTRSAVQKTREVCTVSGIFMSSLESDTRKQDHKNGRQYTGWTKIRNKLDELKKKNLPPPHAQGGRGDRDRRDDYRDDYRDDRRGGDRDRYPTSDGRRDRVSYRDDDYDRDRRDSRDRRDYDRYDDRDHYRRDRSPDRSPYRRGGGRGNDRYDRGRGYDDRAGGRW